MMIVQKLHPDAIIPTRATDGAAGYDLYSLEDYTLDFFPVLVSTGIAFDIPEGWAGFIWPRSGLAVRHGVDRYAGLCDSDYKAEVKVALTSIEPLEIRKGDRIAQMVFQKVETPELVEGVVEENSRGSFGSTGK